MNNAFEHIENDALKFCSGLFSLVKLELEKMTAFREKISRTDMGAQSRIGRQIMNRLERSGRVSTKRDIQIQQFGEILDVDKKVKNALENVKARKICQTALDQQVTPKVADEEILGLKTVEDPELGNETRAFQVLHGALQTHHSWQQLLKRVCADECKNLLIERTEPHALRVLSEATVDLGANGAKGTVPELCAKEVVQKELQPRAALQQRAAQSHAPGAVQAGSHAGHLARCAPSGPRLDHAKAQGINETKEQTLAAAE